MGFFKVCNGCDSRFPGCHSQCEKYKGERAEYEALMEVERKNKSVNVGLWEERTKKVSHAKSRRFSKGYTNGKKV